MPSPVGHSIAAAILHEWLPPGRRGPLWLVVALVSANLPDLDFVPGMLTGNADRFHHGPVHSFSVAVIWGALVLGAARLRMPAREAGALGLLAGAAFASHVFLDMFSIDSRPPFGVPALWPLWGGYVVSPVELFMDICRQRDTALFLRSLLQPHNFLAVAWEGALVGGLYLVLRVVRRRRMVAPPSGPGLSREG